MKCDKCGAPVKYREQHQIGLAPRYDDSEQIKQLEYKNTALKETNRRLNRRCQLAESAVLNTIEDCRRQGVSFGRILACAGYAMLEEENKMLKRYEIFVKHIEAHLIEGQVVVCKICGKTIDEISAVNENLTL